MTVAEMVEKLKWCNQEAEVKIVVGLIGHPVYKIDPEGKFVTKDGVEKAIVGLEVR